MKTSKVSLLIIAVFVTLIVFMIFLPSYIVPSKKFHESTPIFTEENNVTTIFMKKNITFYIYGSIGCPACRIVKGLLEENFKAKIVFYELSGNEEYLKKFYKIYETIERAENKSLSPYIPLTGVFVNDKLTFIVIGFQPLSFWNNIVASSPKNYIVIFYPANSGIKSIIISNTETIEFLEKCFIEKGSI